MGFTTFLKKTGGPDLCLSTVTVDRLDRKETKRSNTMPVQVLFLPAFFQPQVLLRYLMYAARTKFKAPDGISLLYNSPTERKNDEEAAIEAQIANSNSGVFSFG